MRPIRILVIYLAFVFLGAALVAPWIYGALQLIGQHALGDIAKQPFHRYVNRSLIILALAGLWPFLRALGIRSWRDLGFAPIRLHWKGVVAGFAAGFLSLAVLAGLVILLGARSLNLTHSVTDLCAKLAGAILTGVVVAVLEETLFRGALFGTLRKAQPWPLALGVSSAIYAIVHFFAKAPPPASVNWLSGFRTLAEMLRGFADFQTLVPGFFNLLIVGAILALMYQRTGNLYFSIGLHAGWIFWLKSYGVLTKKVSGASSWLSGTGKMTDGWLATAILLLTLLALFLFTRRTNRDSHAVR